MSISGRIKRIMAASVCLVLLTGCGVGHRDENIAAMEEAEQRESISSSVYGETFEWGEGAPILERPSQEMNALEAAVPGQTTPGAIVPGQTASEAAAPGQTTPEAMAPEQTVPEAAAPGQAVPEATVPGQTVPEAAAPGQAVPEATVPGQAVPEAAVPGQTASEAAAPGQAVPEAAVPGQTAPEAVAPGQTIPEAVVPEQTAPGRTVPEQPEPPLQIETPQTGGHIIAIDAGHQAKGNKEKEPLGPGSEELKAKVSSGTRGVSTGVYEYELNLTIAQALQAELEARGYTIVMIRDSHDVDISNKERAETANASGAEIFLRIHANGSEKSSVHGTLTICNTALSPYNPGIHDESLRLSQEVLSHMVALMGSKDRGVWETDTMSGINWSAIPVTIIEMGYMSNAEEDELMQTADYQNLIVRGIADGVDAYFAGADISR